FSREKQRVGPRAFARTFFSRRGRSRRQHYFRARRTSPRAGGDQDQNDNNVVEMAMGLQEQKIESLPFVTAELNYLAPTPGKPRTYAFDPPPGEPKSTILSEPHAVPIFDARPIAQNLSLDREGFALVRHPTVVKNFYDELEIKKVYYPAVEAFLRATLNADRVVIFDHTVRRRVEG